MPFNFKLALLLQIRRKQIHTFKKIIISVQVMNKTRYDDEELKKLCIQLEQYQDENIIVLFTS